MEGCVVVTGASSGLGEHIARAFQAAGRPVIGCDIAEPGPDAPPMHFLQCDMGDREAIARTFELIAHDHEVETLVNNVGVAGPIGAIDETDPEAWETTFRINLLGAYHTIRHLSPGMKARGVGNIVNISTASTKTRPVGRSSYVVSKAALEALTSTLARELGPFGIRCNALLPGPLRNDRMMRILRAHDADRPLDELIADVVRHQGSRRLTEPTEVAAVALFLSTEAARNINGELIAVDGYSAYE